MSASSAAMCGQLAGSSSGSEGVVKCSSMAMTRMRPRFAQALVMGAGSTRRCRTASGPPYHGRVQATNEPLDVPRKPALTWSDKHTYLSSEERGTGEKWSLAT